LVKIMKYKKLAKEWLKRKRRFSLNPYFTQKESVLIFAAYLDLREKRKLKDITESFSQ